MNLNLILMINKTKMSQLKTLLTETKTLSNKLFKNITGVNQLSNVIKNNQMATLKTSMKNIEKTSLQNNNQSKALIQSLKTLQGLIDSATGATGNTGTTGIGATGTTGTGTGATGNI